MPFDKKQDLILGLDPLNVTSGDQVWDAGENIGKWEGR